MTGQVNLIKLKAPVTPVSEPGTPLVQEGPLLLGDVHARLPQSAHLHHQHHLHHHHQLLCTEIEKEKVTFHQSYFREMLCCQNKLTVSASTAGFSCQTF